MIVAEKGFLPVAALLFVAFSLLHAKESSSAKPDEMISVTKFAPKAVIGHLGHPLGTVLRVTGMTVDGDDTRRKADSGQTLLKIETVNGKRLEKPLYFTFRRATMGLDKPDANLPFDYFVHGWGSFDGVVVPPKELGIDTPIADHDGFYYRPEITIHKSNSVERGPKRQGN